MKLSTLLNSLKSCGVKYDLHGPSIQNVSRIVDDSRNVIKDSLFVAIKGIHVDAHNFIDDSTIKGARTIVCEKLPVHIKEDVSYLVVENSRKALSILASAWFGHPSSKMSIIGVTGTDGKTTTSTLIYSILKYAKINVGLISTVAAMVKDKSFDTGFHVTSPEPLKFHEFLVGMQKEGVTHLVLETTSIGLDQERVAGINYEVGVLTNITYEHLDYHKSFESYKKAKSRMFKGVKAAILNKDDESYKYILERLSKDTKVLSYSLKEKSANFYAKKYSEGEKGTKITISENNTNSYGIQSPLYGDYNVSNVLAAAAVARYYGIDLSKGDPLKLFSSPPGRLQEINNKLGFKVFVDFAHTPNALKSVLTLLKKQTRKKLIVVFGSAGERDAQKRPAMGLVAGKLADVSIITAEDPRSEDVGVIIDQIVSGALQSGAKEIDYSTKASTFESKRGDRILFRVPDRGEAIYLAIQKIAKKGDIVVTCGKGHEQSMCYGKVEYPWSDKKAVELALKGKKLDILKQ